MRVMVTKWTDSLTSQHGADLKCDDIDMLEVNEAFAAQALALVKELGLP